MFQEACKQYWNLSCGVGGGTHTTKGKLHGKGCLLTPNHVLTAQHVWEGIRGRYSWPVVLKFDGLFRCEAVFEAPQQDMLILKATEQLDGTRTGESPKYPVISDQVLGNGASVGIMSSLHLMETPSESNTYTAFASGSVAFMQPPDGKLGVSFALSGCVVQKGMSGSPAFRPDGSLVGVFVQTVSFRADYEDPRAPIYTLPVIAPISPIRARILAALST